MALSLLSLKFGDGFSVLDPEARGQRIDHRSEVSTEIGQAQRGVGGCRGQPASRAGRGGGLLTKAMLVPSSTHTDVNYSSV